MQLQVSGVRALYARWGLGAKHDRRERDGQQHQAAHTAERHSLDRAHGFERRSLGGTERKIPTGAEAAPPLEGALGHGEKLAEVVGEVEPEDGAHVRAEQRDASQGAGGAAELQQLVLIQLDAHLWREVRRELDPPAQRADTEVARPDDM